MEKQHYTQGTQENYNSFSSRDLMIEKGKKDGRGAGGEPPSSRKNSAAKKIQRVLKRHTEKRRTQNSAAKKIQKVFRNYRISQLNKMLKEPTCLKELIHIKNENLYMYVKAGEKEEHLFNIFNFKPRIWNPLRGF